MWLMTSVNKLPTIAMVVCVILLAGVLSAGFLFFMAHIVWALVKLFLIVLYSLTV